MLQPLVALTFETPLKPSRDFGPKGKLLWIPLEKLRIDDAYQRPVNEKGKANVRRVAETFRWSKFEIPMVTPRKGGVFAIINGQHRSLGALVNGGVKSIPCWVIEVSPEEEADAFAAINGIVTAMHPLYLYKALLAAGDAVAKAIDRVTKKAGVIIAPYPRSDLAPNETLAVGTVERAIARFGEAAVAAGLKLIVGNAAGAPRALSTGAIAGAAEVLFANPKWLLLGEKLFAALAKGTLVTLESDARVDTAKHGGVVRTHFAKALSERLKAKLGDGGGEHKKPVSKAQQARTAARQGVAPAFTRSPAKPPPSNAIKADERAQIDAFLKAKGARKFEGGATGHTSNLIDWLNHIGVTAQRLAKPAARGGKAYRIGGRNYDLKGFLAVVDRERAKRNLEPIGGVHE